MTLPLSRRAVLALPFLAAAPAFAAEAEKNWVKLDVPYVPTPPVVIEAMMKIAGVKPDDVLYDLGSGDGRIPIVAVRDHKVRKAVGIELNPARVAEAKINLENVGGLGGRVTFIEGDVFKVDFREASVVTMYLLPNVNLRLRPRILDELAPGTRIVSHQFHMFDWLPDDTVMGQEDVPVYFWVVPAKVEGKWRGKIGRDSADLDLAQTFQFVDGTLAFADTRAKMTQIKLKGDVLAFDTALRRGGRDTPMHFQGKVSGDAMTGALIVDGVKSEIALNRVR